MKNSDAKRHVLDIAGGDRQGSAVLVTVAAKVIGVEADNAAGDAEVANAQLASAREAPETPLAADGSTERTTGYLHAAIRVMRARIKAGIEANEDATNRGAVLGSALSHQLQRKRSGHSDAFLRKRTGRFIPTEERPASVLRVPLAFYPKFTPPQITALRSALAAAQLFDPEWYRSQYPDASWATDCWEHLIRVGLGEDRDPHPIFDTAWYREQIPAGLLRRTYPLVHFCQQGGRTGISPHPLFDSAWYLANNPEVAEAGLNPLTHFLLRGAGEGRAPHPAFQLDWYARSRTAEALGQRNPLIDYLVEPDAATSSPHPLFDGAWYCEQNPDVARRGENPLVHYLTIGFAEGCDPHPLFDTSWYLEQNPDAAARRVHPFLHFLHSDAWEYRRASPWFDPQWYLDQYDDVRRAGINPLIHYVTRGEREGRLPGSSLPPSTTINSPGKSGYLPLGIEQRLADDRPAPEHSEWASGETPPPFEEYRLPDPLREYIIDRFGDATVPFVGEMMAIISRHEEDPAAFAASWDCGNLLARLRHAATDPELEQPPDVSIVMPVYNNLLFTLTCLLSLFAMPARCRFEVVIGDDASTDRSSEILPLIGGRVRHFRHPENLGFLLNCNVTSNEARGRYLILLNNDIIVLPGWLDELIGTFAIDEKIGCVGSKLINSDGTLQEAGAIFWSDGTAWNYGRNQNPRLPEFNYVKDVDYCSGAAIALPKPVWEALDGFDLRYVPAYCEDSDLAFRLRAAGMRTLYQPFAEVIHHEGKTNGRDTSSGVKAYQTINDQKLFERWSHLLVNEHFASAEQVFLARDRSLTRPHILFIDHYVPQWDRDAGSRTIFLYLKLFVAEGFQVSFSPDNLYYNPIYTKVLQRLGIEVIYSEHYIGRFGDWIRRNGSCFKYVFLSRAHVSINYIDELRRHVPGTIMYYGHDLNWCRLVLEHIITKNDALIAEIDEWRAREDAVCAKSDVIFYPAPEECDLVRRKFPAKKVIEFPVIFFDRGVIDLAGVQAEMDQRDAFHLMFVGGFVHRPNVDGVIWFVREVFERLCARDRRFRFTIVGSYVPDEISALASARIEVAGQISDEKLVELYRTAGAAVVPLRFGAGVKGKVIESFAHGIPLIATTIGMQGVAGVEDLAFVADDPLDFAEKVFQACTDRHLAMRKVCKSLELITADYSRDHVRTILSSVIEEFRD